MKAQALIAIFLSAQAFAGMVTPTSITYTFTRITVTGESQTTSLIEGSFEKEFLKSDTDLSGSVLGSFTLPEDRYTQIGYCYSTTVKVKIDGETYQGSAGAFSNGATIYSTGTDATASNSIVTSAPGGGASQLTLTLTGSSGATSEFCGKTVYSVPICVKTGGTGCQSGDVVIDPAVTAPDVNLLVDLSHGANIDSTNAKLTSINASPLASFGKPGAAIHLSYDDGTNYADETLLFSAEKKLVSAFGYGSAPAGFCGGYSGLTLSTTNEVTTIGDFDSTTGKVQHPVGHCSPGPGCNSVGMFTADNVLQVAGSTVNVTCPADSAAVPPYLGFTYTSGSGTAGTASFRVQRVVDPSNLFNICPSGTCGAYP